MLLWKIGYEIAVGRIEADPLYIALIIRVQKTLIPPILSSDDHVRIPSAATGFNEHSFASGLYRGPIFAGKLCNDIALEFLKSIFRARMHLVERIF